MTTSNALPFGCGCDLRRLDPQGELLADADPPVLGDLVGDVDEADRAERERAVRHQRHVQREGEHVGVGRRQVVAEGEAADLGVGGDRAGSAVTPSSSSRTVRDLAAAAGDERQARERPARSGSAARA